jgi:hypothetical protein
VAKLKTPEQKERDRNTRLLRVYGRSAAECHQMAKEQNFVCKICGSDGGKRALHVDHDHKYKYIKIVYHKDKVWFGAAVYRGHSFIAIGATKGEVSRDIRSTLKRNSCRGLLCWPCNRLLRMSYDQPERLAKAAQYLREFQTFTASATTNKE